MLESSHTHSSASGTAFMIHRLELGDESSNKSRARQRITKAVLSRL